MVEIKKFDEFDRNDWTAPLKIKDINGDTITTSIGEFINSSGVKITKGYSNILKLDGDKIVDVGMSCVDIVILFDTGSNYKVLSIKRGKEPFLGMWANPGGNIDEGETPIDAAIRELEEETNISINKGHFYYVGSYDKPWRDPRNKNCISYAFVIDANKAFNDILPNVIAGDDASDYQWVDVDYNGKVSVEMAFDHAEIIKDCIKILNK